MCVRFRICGQPMCLRRLINYMVAMLATADTTSCLNNDVGHPYNAPIMYYGTTLATTVPAGSGSCAFTTFTVVTCRRLIFVLSLCLNHAIASIWCSGATALLPRQGVSRLRSASEKRAARSRSRMNLTASTLKHNPRSNIMAPRAFCVRAGTSASCASRVERVTPTYIPYCFQLALAE